MPESMTFALLLAATFGQYLTPEVLFSAGFLSLLLAAVAWEV